MNAIQSVFKHEYQGLRSSLSLDQLKAADNIISCRTAKMGARELRCPSGEAGHDYCYMYNSCHYRHCPQCNAIPRAKWLKDYQSKSLNCAHRQVVFTIPHELNKLWLYNKKELSNLLFRSVSNTLKVFLHDPKWLGATAGFSLVLHTWGRNLSLHPHIHAVITEGGLSADGWIKPKHKEFLPAVAMMHKFRGAYIGGLRKLLRQEKVTMPEGVDQRELRKTLDTVYREKKWNLKVEKGSCQGSGLTKYLSRYLKGGPISPNQVKSDGGSVKLRYKDHRTGLIRRHRFSNSGFMKQLLTHIPPRSMPMIRHHGLYAGSNKELRDQAAQLLPTGTAIFTIEGHLRSIGIKRSDSCSVCSRTMKVRTLTSRELTD